ncbi:hypothetical protein B4N89_31485 [Embleya scabrispora]|uniref:Uncharacterized protein n=1 Tax=Embleya scabrispora TaxID=159449 RepID=A0A1T3NPQ6_9ACTN|nr:hypothetical protein [Embleya scabrispora]OPC78690.1 hypothetical protein B4N89_31485 [Embleya scabrispora]
MATVIDRTAYPNHPHPTWRPPQKPPRPRPHGVRYAAPAAAAGASVLCAVAAVVVRFGARVAGSLRDTSTYGDGSPVPPHPWNDHQGTIDLWLLAAVVTAALAAACFVGTAVARGRAKRRRGLGSSSS